MMLLFDRRLLCFTQEANSMDFYVAHQAEFYDDDQDQDHDQDRYMEGSC